MLSTLPLPNAPEPTCEPPGRPKGAARASWSFSRSFSRSFSSSLLVAIFGCLVLLTQSGCPDKKTKYPACAADKDCKDGEKCINKQCLQCGTDEDCDDGFSCESGECQRKQGSCGSDEDCTDGKICKKNQCVSCEADADCGTTGRCSNGACLERGKCKVDEDCQDDEDCVDGVCQRLGRGKPPEVDCQLVTIYFGFDATELNAEARDLLNKIAECIQKAAERNVFIGGHTDPRGTEEYNIALSERRAQVVADYLARLGIDPARFRVVPRGETQSSGVDDSSWNKDRKVTFEWQ